MSLRGNTVDAPDRQQKKCDRNICMQMEAVLSLLQIFWLADITLCEHRYFQSICLFINPHKVYACVRVRSDTSNLKEHCIQFRRICYQLNILSINMLSTCRVSSLKHRMGVLYLHREWVPFTEVAMLRRHFLYSSHKQETLCHPSRTLNAEHFILQSHYYMVISSLIF